MTEEFAGWDFRAVVPLVSGLLLKLVGASWSLLRWTSTRRADAGSGIAAAGGVRTGGNLTIQPDPWSPAALVVLALGLIAAVAALVLVGDRQEVGTGILDPGTIENSTITIEGAPR